MSNMYFITSDSLSDFMEVKYIIWAGDIEDLVLPGTWTIPAGQKKLKSDCPHMPDSIKTLWEDPEDNNYVILPDMTGRFCMMETDPTGVGVLHEAQAPNTQGSFTCWGSQSMPEPIGVFNRPSTSWESRWETTGSGTYGWQQINFKLSYSSSIYQDNATVRPQSLSVLVLLRL